MFPGPVGCLRPALVIHVLTFLAFGCNLDGSLCFWLPTTNQMLTLVSWFPFGFAKNAFSFCGKVLKMFFWKERYKTRGKIACLGSLGWWNVHTSHKFINSTAKMLNSMANWKNSGKKTPKPVWLRSLRFLRHESENGRVFTPLRATLVLSYMLSLVSFCICSFKVSVSQWRSLLKGEGCNAVVYFLDITCTLQTNPSSRMHRTMYSKRQQLCMTALEKQCVSGSSFSSKQ